MCVYETLDAADGASNVLKRAIDAAEELECVTSLTGRQEADRGLQYLSHTRVHHLTKWAKSLLLGARYADETQRTVDQARHR